MPIDCNHIMIMFVHVVYVITIMMFRLVVEYQFKNMMIRLMVGNIVLIMIINV